MLPQCSIVWLCLLPRRWALTLRGRLGTCKAVPCRPTVPFFCIPPLLCHQVRGSLSLIIPGSKPWEEGGRGQSPECDRLKPTHTADCRWGVKWGAGEEHGPLWPGAGRPGLLRPHEAGWPGSLRGTAMMQAQRCSGVRYLATGQRQERMGGEGGHPHGLLRSRVCSWLQGRPARHSDG